MSFRFASKSGGFLPLILSCAGIVVFLTVAYLQYTQDDVFITYTYSRNLAEGNGFVFNPGERIQGTTTPLWAILMAGVYKLTPDLLSAGNIISGSLLIVILIFSYYTVKHKLGLLSLAIMLITLASAPILYLAFGMETMLYCTVLVSTWLTWSRRRYSAAFALAGVLTWVRADGVVLAGAMGICLLISLSGQFTRKTVLRYTKYVFIYLLVIAPWFLFAALYFGSPLPNTFSAKADFFGGIDFLVQGWNLFETYYGNNPLRLLALILVPVGGARLLRSEQLRLVPVWCLAYAVGYTLLNTTYFWYYAPLTIGLLVLTAAGLDSAVRWSAKSVNGSFLQIAILVGGVFTLLVGISIAYSLRTIPSRMVTYRLAGEWIAANTPKFANITVADLGVAGYYMRRQTIDTFGLIQRGNYSIAPDYVVAKHRTDYVLGTNYYVFDRLESRDWFQEQYRPEAQFSTLGDLEFSPMTVYARIYPLTAPLSVVQGLPFALSCMMDLAAGEAVPRTIAEIYNAAGERVLVTRQRFRAGDYRMSIGGEILIDQIIVETVDLLPGPYEWKLSCKDSTVGTINILSLDETPDHVDIDLSLGENTLLTAHLTTPTEVWSGGAVVVALQWDVTSSDSVHLAIEDDNRRWAESDPLIMSVTAGFTREWTILLPPDIPAGNYTITVNAGGESVRLPFSIAIKFPGGSGLP